MEKGPKISPEDLTETTQETKDEKAKRELQEAFDETADLPEKEREEKLFSIPGVEKGESWDKMQKHLRKKQE